MAKPAILHVIGKNAITMHINHEGVNINGLVFFQEATTIAYFAEGQMHVIVQEGEPHPLNMPKEHIERLTECLNNPEGKDKDKEFEKFLDDILKFIAVNAKLKGLKIEPPASS